mmetsp:Transcript_67170/g.165788  ORF Transcript_67170/g.165788 Transcript_67170/m.165788 type:complete len:279 (-) Transcript_67170:1119-1955(-)
MKKARSPHASRIVRNAICIACARVTVGSCLSAGRAAACKKSILRKENPCSCTIAAIILETCVLHSGFVTSRPQNHLPGQVKPLFAGTLERNMNQGHHDTSGLLRRTQSGWSFTTWESLSAAKGATQSPGVKFLSRAAWDAACRPRGKRAGFGVCQSPQFAAYPSSSCKTLKLGPELLRAATIVLAFATRISLDTLSMCSYQEHHPVGAGPLDSLAPQCLPTASQYHARGFRASSSPPCCRCKTAQSVEILASERRRHLSQLACTDTAEVHGSSAMSVN